MTTSKAVGSFADLPDPGGARTLDEFVERLKSLKIWAGNPSYEVITDRIRAAWSQAGRPQAELARRGTVVDCFKTGRRRVNADLIVAVVEALRPDTGYVAQWRQALRCVLGETRAAAQVKAQDRLPGDHAHFTGRGAELQRLLCLSRRGKGVLATIEGMAGIGKTQLAIRAGHLLASEFAFDRVLFVALRGFHPDPAQPPADPAAVLDSFLRLLGRSGQEIPHDLEARSDLFRKMLAGQRVLLVLDDAADEEQIRPLLPHSPGCLTLVTSRRSLSGIPVTARLMIEIFSADEAVELLKRTAPDVPVGRDPQALDRIAGRCGYLPLALSLVAARLRTAADWTLTDHADRLDERHREQRLDSGIELALGLSYDHLPPERRRLLRMLALHPGPDFDEHAAATLAGTGSATTIEGVRQLCQDHLLHEGPAGRYAIHDLVRAHAAQRAADEDRPAERRAALSRLFDHYLATASAAMDSLYPADRNSRPRVAAAGTPVAPVDDLARARGWLDAERPNLVATAICAAGQASYGHTTKLASTLVRYLISGYFHDAITIFDQARIAAQAAGDPAAEAQALFGLGTVHGGLSRYAEADDYLHHALGAFRRAGDRVGQGRALGNLGAVAQRRAQWSQAKDFHQQALALFDEVGDVLGAARALNNLGQVESRLGHHDLAAVHLQRGLDLHRQAGDTTGEGGALINLGNLETTRGRHAVAAGYHDRALELFRMMGHRSGQAWALDGIGAACTGAGRAADAADHHRTALELFRQIGERDGEASALNGLGEAQHAAGQRHQAAGHHQAALAIAAQIEVMDQEARAHKGLAQVHFDAERFDDARHHWREALTRYDRLGAPESEQVRAQLAALGT
jgi:tetratricopeptide (TPR) repeat protein